MRHSLDFGLLNHVDLSDEKLKAALPKAAISELAKTGGNKNYPAKYLVNQILETFDAGVEFTVNDIYILLHEGAKELVLKMATLRSTLSTLAKQKESPLSVASNVGKNRLYVKK